MKILDWYILKRYLMTFSMLMLLFVPIGIVVDLSEKVDKMIDRKAPIDEVLMYYGSFSIYFANILFPILLFLSIIWFTSKLANNTEIIAILSSGISFNRFLRPFFIGASVVSVVVFFMGMFIVPAASKYYNEFYNKYLQGKSVTSVTDLYNQFSENDYLYVSSFNYEEKMGYNFSVEHFDKIHLKEKIMAQSIKWIENDSVKTYRLTDYVKRTVGENEDIIERKQTLDTLFTFEVDDLMPVEYAAESKNIFELNKFIERERMKGSPNLNLYLLVKYRRWGLMITAFILTIIGVAVSSVKRRGGMGINLAFGIVIGFVFVFFDRIFGTLAETSGLSPLMAVAIPNVIFFILAVYLLKSTRR
ncbi:LptF/LptG family permease [Capnocytophaga stomatis]|uniref:LptF/LptG family permease n=1 Tax=Capnocytophaga stomatis TaxID=1848904 RepID=UPI001ACD8CE1|nr:LptF/LptG family permease [Capnocytophaga stomatis]GIM49519.1 membrane protein [Capnocytophaga stomatis]